MLFLQIVAGFIVGSGAFIVIPWVTYGAMQEPPGTIRTLYREQTGAMPKLNRDDTLFGVDANNNEVRDDVEQYIDSLKDTPLQKKALTVSAALTTRVFKIADDEPQYKFIDLQQKISASTGCLNHIYNYNFAGKFLYYTLNTDIRRAKQYEFDQRVYRYENDWHSANVQQDDCKRALSFIDPSTDLLIEPPLEYYKKLEDAETVGNAPILLPSVTSTKWNQTLLGIDENRNGLRDEVDQILDSNISDSLKNEREFVVDFAKAFQVYIVANGEPSKSIDATNRLAEIGMRYQDKFHKEFKNSITMLFAKSVTFDTPDRQIAYQSTMKAAQNEISKANP